MDDLRSRAELGAERRAELAACHGDSFGWAMCCCRRDPLRAEEVLQRTYLKVLGGAARYDGRGAFKTWLFAVIRTTAADERRRELVRRLNLLRYADLTRRSPPAPPPSPAEVADDDDAGDARRATFAAALDALPRRQREVLQLVFYHDLSLAGAAGVMGVSVGSARTHYDRGKKAVRRWLEEHEADESRPETARASGGRPDRTGPTPCGVC